MAEFQVQGDDHLQKQLKAFFAAMQDNLKQEQKETLQSLILTTETLEQKIATAVSKSDIEPIVKQLNDVSEKASKMMNDMQANQSVIDNFVANYNKGQTNSTRLPQFDENWSDMIKNEYLTNKDAIFDLQKKSGTKLEFNLKTVLTTSNAITGGGMISYNQNVGLLPTVRLNMRDLLPTTPSENGNYITYRETNPARSAGVQTEGSAKAALDYAFTAVTVVLKYIAGMSTFSKQLLFNLNFLNGKLPQMLLRDFYRKENDYLYTTIAVAATGVNTTVGTFTVDIEEVIMMIANQRKAGFNADVGLIDWAQRARILVTKPADYSLPPLTDVSKNVVNIGGTGGRIDIDGMPVFGANWAQTDHLLLWDRDYVERVEGESLRVEFSYENQDNFEKNLVTARVECFEEVNLLRTDAVIYRDFGNS